jgi:hypothetical protein
MAEEIQNSFIEATGLGVFENWCSRVGITLARPNRADLSVDVVALNDDLVTVPIQMKIVLHGGMTIWDKYRGRALTLVYVFLGDGAGGTSGEDTRFVIIDPDTVWTIPSSLGLKHDMERTNSYRWARTTKALREALEPYTVRTPSELRERLFPEEN